MDPNNQPNPPTNLQPQIAEDTAPSSQADLNPVVEPTQPIPLPVEETGPVEPPPPIIEEPMESSSVEEIPEKKGISPLIWVVVAVLLIFVLVGGYFILQQTVFSGVGSSDNESMEGIDIPPTGTPVPQATPTIEQVPTVSDDTSLEVIDAELNSLNAGDYETELKSLDSETTKL
ncbi:hypothetical protein CO050_05465 [Candidatus Roizmanbacteria bacterium CG_4_9_14_0_2_um_filter_38_17]|nr:MAG: hypothetical protein CO050_05465 [Candidatus Roizmanbacteria bacterium CG_4_9_14_0_2_um_filter_38_17]